MLIGRMTPVAVLLGCLILPVDSLGSGKNDSWNSLNGIPKRRTYTFVAPDRTCTEGRIVSLAPDSITIRTPDRKNVQLKRSDILRIIDGSQQRDVVYSGRSSWSDVKAIPLNSKEEAEVITRNGASHHGKLVSISDLDLTIQQSGKHVTFAKGDIFRVDYLRFKPMTDSAVYAAQEFVFIDPELWPYMMNLEGKIAVQLYDSSLPDDNGPITCKKKQ